MPAFIDPNSTVKFTVREHVAVCKREGECECPPACLCPNTPHSQDTVTARNKLGLSDLAKITRAFYKVDQELLLLDATITDWTFVNDKGDKVPLGLASINLLDADLGHEIAQWIDGEIGKAKLPNGSSGRSLPESPDSSAAPTTSPTPST